MWIVGKAYDGAITGFKNLLVPAPEIEGVFANRGGLPLITLIGGIAVGCFVDNPQRVFCASGAVGTYFGGLKGSQGGIVFFPNQFNQINTVLNKHIFQVMFLVAGGLTAQFASPYVYNLVGHSPICAGAAALVGTAVGAVAAGALKNVIESGERRELVY